MCLLLSAYCFIFCFCSRSRQRIIVSSLCLGCFLTSGNFPRNSLPNMSWLQAQLLCMLLFPCALNPSQVCINLSTSLLASAHPGVTFRCSNPSPCVYSSNLWLLKGCPLSDFISLGTLYVSNTLLNIGIVAFSLVDPANSTTCFFDPGKLITYSTCSPIDRFHCHATKK